MKEKLLPLLPYAAVLAVLFYAAPLLIVDTGSAMVLLLIVIPLLTLVCGAVYGCRRGFSLLFPLMTAVLFTPTLFIFYNASAWVYLAVYAVIALAGTGIGRAMRKK